MVVRSGIDLISVIYSFAFIERHIIGIKKDAGFYVWISHLAQCF